MHDLVLALDLGTGSCKASVWHADGRCLAASVRPYSTSYVGAFHEQRLDVWWDALVESTREVVGCDGVHPDAIAAIAVSGQSLGTIGLDASGHALRNSTPIWSDSRGADAASRAFARFDEQEWYRLTGNGFPAGLYPVFKLGWYAQHDAEFLRDLRTVVGSKDWVNAKLTGVIATDPSYASGSGAWNLREGEWSSEVLDAAEVSARLWPEVVPSTTVLGQLTPDSAAQLGLSTRVVVVAGGVDNSCMSAGSRSVRSGAAFASLGSSSWFVATGDSPVIDPVRRPYTFASLLPGLYDSALSSFSSGVTLRWVRSLLGTGAPIDDDTFIALAEQSEPGARGLVFLPMLTGGAPHEGGPNARGALLGLDSSHTAADLARAAIEGTVFAISRAARSLDELVDIGPDIVVSGGGSRSPWVRQIYADALDRTVIATTVDQQAAALGAAATAFVGIGAWPGLDAADSAHEIVARHTPQQSGRYAALVDRFETAMSEHMGKGHV